MLKKLNEILDCNLDWNLTCLESDDLPLGIYWLDDKYYLVEKQDYSKKYWGRKSNFKVIIEGKLSESESILQEDISEFNYRNFRYAVSSIGGRCAFIQIKK